MSVSYCVTGRGAVPELDLRGLPAPEPLLQALAAADALAPGGLLRVWTPLLPLPLLQALAERGLRYDVLPTVDGIGACVQIERCTDGAARD
ncbi:DUF2249 domain-containing protein [Tahibacter caeni]|uniref:DUF2249 domain-containing protein n=1 Tax=Tahibacter caeni TaxID=1453545 RepID=UPI0021473BF3|nr:DUF2249 domain-containing protein [Tahibacter caeni]